MISSIIDVVLLAALAGTSGAVILMYRKLQRFDALQGEAAKEFARTAAALDRAREAIGELSADGGEMAVTLATRLNEARVVMNEIDEATLRTRDAFAVAQQDLRSEPAAIAPAAAIASAVDADIAATQAERDPTPMPAALRIKNAARARIEAAKAKAANGEAPSDRDAPRPVPIKTAPLPERLAPRIHRASEEASPLHASAHDRRGNGPAMVLMKGREEPVAPPAWAAPAARLTWTELARAAQHAS